MNRTFPILTRFTIQRIERRYDELNDILKQMVGTVIPPELRFDEIEDPEVLECGYQKGAWIDDLLKENDQSDILVGSGAYSTKEAIR